MTGDVAGTVVRLAERERHPDGSFTVRVSFGDWAEHDVTVTDPADTAGEALLGWYFEEHLRYPFLDKDHERAAVEQLTAYGEALFEQVFGGAASHEYRLLRDVGFERCRVEVSGSAGLHRLHWEALRDPGLAAPLAVRLPVTRRADRQGLRFSPPSGRPTVNILVVVARPDGPRDVGYRTVSRPLLDALRSAGLPVTVDLVRPGTWDALRAHLQAVTEQRGPGWYHVVHFDLHGSFSDYAALEAGRAQERLLFAPAALESFEGQQGFLYFETAETGKAGPVPAGEVASLLAEHRVPVAVLNACQSAMQTGAEAGLAQRLAEAGVPVAVGMAYSVTVSAAERAMPVLYGRLAAGADPVTAVHAARRELFEHPARRAYFGQQLDLADWVLPVVFAQQPLRLELRPMSGEEQAAFYGRAAKVGPEPATEYGFVGRDLDIQAVEHRLLAGPGSNQLLVRGMAGAGKSTLLNHLAWWWQRTGLVEEVFRFSYEDRAWTSAQITRAIRERLLSPAEHAQADSMSEEAQAEQVAALLRSRRHLLILDNTESVTAAPAAIPHALDAAERGKLKALLAGLAGGRTLVLLGSREPESWLTDGGGGPGVYPLPGLDPQAASVLVAKILTRHHADRYLQEERERDPLQELVKLLGGYPLPLTVVLPVLASVAPSVVLAELKAGGSGADPAGLISKAIEYSHGKLDPALQDSLLLLAPFTAVICTGAILDRYRDHLMEHDAVKALGPIDLPAALEQAVSVGLAAPHSQLGSHVQLQPVLPWFLRSRLQDHPALAAAASQAHYQLYQTHLGPVLYGMLTSPGNPEQRITGQAATVAEYANLTTALAYGLRTSQPVIVLIGPLDEYLDQAQQHDTRRQLLHDTISAYPAPTSSAQQQELIVLNDLAAHAAILSHRLDDARARYETVLRLLEATGNRLSLGTVYHQLGYLAQEQRRFAEAEASYRQALDIFLESGDGHSAATTYHQLGMLAQDQRRFTEAEASYRQALEIRLELGERRHAASTYHQLGILAQEQWRLAEAEASYRQALEIKLEFGDRHSAASTYHQLGIVAQRQERFTEAEASYRQALEIKLEFGDRHSAASTYHQLGIVARQQERFTEAEASHRKALDIYQEFGDQPHAATVYHQLGRVAQGQRRLAEAEASYRQALEIRLEFGDRYSAADTYYQLGRVAQEQRRFTEAEASCRQALDIYQEFGDQRSVSRTASQLGIVYASLGQQHDAARTLLYAAVTWRQETGKWAREDLQWLHRERAAIGAEEFAALMTAETPADIRDELTAAIDIATDPDLGEDAGSPG